MRKCCFPGSFDPISNGHIDIINRISKLYDEVYVIVSNNVKKRYLFTANERCDMLKTVTSHLKNIHIIIYDNLVTRFCEDNSIDVIIRGLRNINDYQDELTLAQFNHDLSPNVETLLLFPSPEKQMVSSSAIKELVYFDADISKYVPHELKDIIYNKIKDSIK